MKDREFIGQEGKDSTMIAIKDLYMGGRLLQLRRDNNKAFLCGLLGIGEIL